MRVGLAPDAIFLELSSPEQGALAVVRMAFEGASSAVELEALDPEPGLYSFFIGNDPSNWRRGMRRYRAVRCRALYPGIDLVLRGEEEHFEYDLLVAPGADLGQVVLRCDGIDGFDLVPDGGVVLRTELGALRQTPGRCWQERLDGTLEELSFTVRRIDESRIAFDVPGRDPALLLTIDPGLVWSTFIGGKGGFSSLGDIARCIVLDENGFLTITGTSEGGRTESSKFPMTPGTFQSSSITGEDVFVTRFRQSDGALVYSSVIGGAMSHEDRAQAVDVDPTGRAVVVGKTSSLDFPTTPGAFDPVTSNSTTAFVLKLSPTGDALEYSTFLEGSSNGTEAYGVIALDSGSAVVGGLTTAPTFPTTPGAFDTTLGTTFPGADDGFLTQLDPTGSFLEWSTFLGGDGGDEIFDIAPDEAGEVVIAGRTTSRDFPVTPGAYQTTYPGIFSSWQAFACRLTADGSDLVWSTYLGGTKDEIGLSIAVDRFGSAVVAGRTVSPDFPTTPGTFQPGFLGGPANGDDAFITRFDSSGSSLVYSTFLGSVDDEEVLGLSVDPSGVVTVAGWTGGSTFPVTPGAFLTGAGGEDAIVARINPSGSKLLYSTRLGGNRDDYGISVAVDPRGRVAVTGQTRSVDFPTTPDAFQPTYTGGGAEAFVTTMDLVLTGVRPFGGSNPSCLGPIVINATEMPIEGAAGFGIYCSGAPPLASGMLLVGNPKEQASSPIEGEFPGPSSILPFQTDAQGYAEIPFPLPPGTKGMRFSLRCIFTNTAACPGVLTRSWSNGLLITVQ